MEFIKFNGDGRVVIPPKPELDVDKLRGSIKPDRITFSELVHDLDKGVLVIPAFQRGIVWSKKETIFLLDSIYKGYPIGSFLIWEAKKDISYVKKIGDYTLNQPNEENLSLSYILDGQQRIASIYACLKEIKIKKESYEVFFDLDNEKFVDKIDNDDIGQYIRFSEALGKKHLELMRELNSERQRVFENLYQAFINYDFSLIRIRNQPIEVVCEIFERVNNTGRKLTVVDLLVAKTWGENFDLRKKLKYYKKNLKKKHFDKIDERNILQCISVHNFNKCHRRDILKLKREQIEKCWGESLNSISMSIDFLKTELNVKDSKILPFPLLIVPISYFFYKKKSGNERQINELKKWFWKASLSNRFDSGIDTKIADDIIQFDKIIKEEVPSFDYQYSFDEMKVKSQKFSTGSAFCKTILSLLAYQRPKNFKNNSEVDINSAFSKYNNKEFHHFFPKSILNKDNFDPEDIESVANICFQPFLPHREIGNEPPNKYLEKFKEGNRRIKETLKSHLIDLESENIKNNDFQKFLDERAKKIVNQLRRFADIERYPTLTEDEFGKEFEEIELLLRKLIKKRLDIIDKKWFKNENYIKKITYDKIINNLTSDQVRNPKITESDFWDYLDLGGIIEILENHKDKFSNIFKKNFVDYNLAVSTIRLLNKARAKEKHKKMVSAINERDLEMLKIQIPTMKESILTYLNETPQS